MKKYKQIDTGFRNQFGNELYRLFNNQFQFRLSDQISEQFRKLDLNRLKNKLFNCIKKSWY